MKSKTESDTPIFPSSNGVFTADPIDQGAQTFPNLSTIQPFKTWAGDFKLESSVLDGTTPSSFEWIIRRLQEIVDLDPHGRCGRLAREVVAIVRATREGRP